MENRIKQLREFYSSGATKSIKLRKEHLRRLKAVILKNQTEIEDALYRDLGKSAQEAYLSEISITLQEIDLHLRGLRKWVKSQRVKTPLHLLPSRSFVVSEPLGTALIIAPWNYPFQLIINPLIGAISAGCTVMLKPSPQAPHTAAVIEKIIQETFPPNFIDIALGDREVNAELLEQKYDIIFFTGGPGFGKVVYQAAAEKMTPVVLELGGKSPCIVDKDANIKVAARRIAWGKWLNAGQTCVAPDYLYVHSAVKEEFLHQLKTQCEKMYGHDPHTSKHYGRIVDYCAFDRLANLIPTKDVYHGGHANRSRKFIAPTIVDNITPRCEIMQSEIFGPLLPVLTFDDIVEVYDYINANDKPLALYYFGGAGDDVLLHTSSGGACINDTIMHILNHHLPFGGVGMSGIGKYHGKSSFDAFSNKRSVFRTPTWIDLPLKYPPFKYFKLIRRIL